MEINLRSFEVRNLGLEDIFVHISNLFVADCFGIIVLLFEGNVRLALSWSLTFFQNALLEYVSLQTRVSLSSLLFGAWLIFRKKNIVVFPLAFFQFLFPPSFTFFVLVAIISKVVIVVILHFGF